MSFFDPIDTGGSSPSPSPSYHTLEHHVAEIDAVRSALSLSRVILLGHSYGGLLALRYALDHPDRVSALILVSGFASIPRLYEEKRRLADTLPPEVADILRRQDAPELHTTEAYQKAIFEWTRRYNYRMNAWKEVPVRLRASWRRGSDVARDALFGARDFIAEGPLAGYDTTRELPRIKLPALLIAGQHDFAGPTILREMAERLSASRTAVMESSAHWSMWEETASVLDAVREFLSREGL